MTWFWFDAAHCMVVWLTRIQYLHVLVVQGSRTVLRPGQAFHDVLCECRVLFAIVPTVAYAGHVQKQVTGEVSITPRAVVSSWFP